MVDRYWVTGGTGQYNSSTNWSATSGGPSGASVPTFAVNVFFDQAATYTVTMPGGACYDFTASAGTVTFTQTTGTFSVTGSMDLTGCTATWSASTFTLSFTTNTAFSGIKTIKTGATTINSPVTCSSGVNSVEYRLLSNFTMGALRTFTWTSTGGTGDTWNLNGFTHTCGFFNSNAATPRTLAFGTGNITCIGAGGTLWTTATTTGLVVTGTPVVNISNSGAVATTVAPGILTEAQAISFNFTSGTYTLTFLTTASYSAKNVDFTGFAGTWGARNVAVTIYGNLTLATGMTLTASTGVVTLGATSGTQSLTFSGKTFNQINVNGVGGTVFLATNPSFSAAPILTNGTLDFNSRAITNQTWTMTTGSVVIKNTDPIIYTFSITQTSGTLTLGSNCAIGGTYTLTAGTLDLGGYALTCGLFSSSNANARTIAFGSGNITCITAGGTLWTTATVTNLTITGTPVVNISNSGAVATTVASGILTEAQAISFNFTTGTYVLTFFGLANYSAKNVDFTGFAGRWAAITSNTIYGNLTISTGMTLTASTGVLRFGATSGTQLVTTNGKTVDFPVTFNGVGGTFKLLDALTMGATRVLTFTNGTFDGDNKTISGASSISLGGTVVKNVLTAVPTVTNSLTAVTMGGPNTFGTFGVFDAISGLSYIDISSYQLTCTSFSSTGSSAKTLYFSGGNITCNGAGGTLFNASAAMVTTGTPIVNIVYSGATAVTVTPGAYPESQAFSFNFTAGTYALTFLAPTSNLSAKNIDFTGFAGTWNGTANGIIYGNLTLSTGMTVALSTQALTFGATSGVQLITSNGKTQDKPLTIDGVGGTVRLADALLMGTARAFTHTNGTLDLNGKTLTVGATYATAAGTKDITFNGGTLVCPAVTTTAFNNVAPTGFTTTAGTGTGKISMTGATGKTFVGGGATYNCTLSNDGAGALTVSGSNTFTTIANGVQPTAFTFTAGTTQTVTDWNVSGTAGNLVTIISSTAGTAATLSKASGVVSSNYLSLKDSTATGGAAWYAGTTSTNVSGNLGWIFTAPPATGNSSSFFFMF